MIDALRSAIAVVEDDALLRTALVGLLQAAGYTARGHASAEAMLGEEALPHLACVISDIQMPGMSGIDLAERIDASGLGLPVILITARTDLAPEQRSRAHPCAILHKPFDAEDLLAWVGHATAHTGLSA